MPITLTEAAKELAQAATTVDVYMDEEYRARVLRDFEDNDGTLEPLLEKVVVGSKTLEIPRFTLRDHTRLEAEEIEIRLESDVNLEGRRLVAPGPQMFSAVKGTNLHGYVGYYLTGSAPWGGIPDDQTNTVYFRGFECSIMRVVYQPLNNKLLFALPVGFGHFDALMGGEMQIGRHGAPESQRLKIKLDDYSNFAMSSSLFTYNVPPGSLSWLSQLQNGELFDIAFIDVGLEKELEQEIGMELERNKTYFDIMVTLKAGLDPTAGHISINTKFVRKPAAEGVAQINDRVNRDLADGLM